MKTFLPVLFLFLLSFSATAQKSAKDLFASGNAKFKAGKYTEAIKDYDLVLKLDPDHVVTITNRGVAKDRLLDYRSAIEDFTKAIALNPKYTVAYTSRGLSKYNLKYYKSALLDYNKAIELNPNDAKAYNNRGMVRYGMKDFGGAVADYTKAISLRPKYAEAYYNRGAPQYDLGEKTKACNDWTLAGTLGVRDAVQYAKKYCGPASPEKASLIPSIKTVETASAGESKSNKVNFSEVMERVSTKIKAWFEGDKIGKKESESKKASQPAASNK